MGRDIIDALTRISAEFRSLNLDVPDAILLKTHDQGMQALCQLHRRTSLIVPMGSDRGGKVIEHPDGSAWMEVEIYGIKVRWPAVKLAKQTGGFVWM
jgi:hypothetical protein